MKTKIVLTCIAILLVTLTGCAREEPESVSPVTINQTQPEQDETLGYPAPETINEVESGYPIAEYTFDYPKGPEFNIDTPVSHDDLSVTGNGPANVPIRLVDVSEIGAVLAETIIDEQGNFIFTLDQPLTSGNTIGIQLGDIENTDFDENQFIYSETYYDRPYIGILFDLVVVD